MLFREMGKVGREKEGGKWWGGGVCILYKSNFECVSMHIYI